MKTLSERLRLKAGIMEMGERIEWGSDTALMREAAAYIDLLEAKLRDMHIEGTVMHHGNGGENG